ncbi:MAG: hypothetical protein DRI94_13130 [Bacteroidetes bacterium]|nr:MAG: hypothetical protein DRI94_13130 [Bacteroidota bacterium]
MKGKNTKIFFLIIFLSVIFIKCDKNKKDVVPNVYVNFTIYINEPDYSELNAIGNSVMVTGGAKGIIIYRNSLNEFCAYDRCCTYKPSEKNEYVQLLEQGSPIVVDSTCGSKFNLVDGSVINGPAVLPLKKYNTTFDGNGVHVYN